MFGFWDSLRGLVNSVTGLGTSMDKSLGGAWFFTPLDDNQLEFAFRSSWLVRKAITIPPFDMVREGWTWEASAEENERIEMIEKRFKVRQKVRDAMIAARLYRGAGIIISDGAQTPEQLAEPLVAENVRPGSIEFLTVASRRYLTAEDPIRDPRDENFGLPGFYSLNGGDGGTVRLHHSRIVRFEGPGVPDQFLGANANDAGAWGDSVLDYLEAVVRDATSGQQGISHLIQEAKQDIIKIPGLTSRITSTDYFDKMVERLQLLQRGKSTLNALVLDKEEEHEQKTINFSQLPEVVQLLLQMVSGAADIPATRLLGQSPAGLNATGESDLRNYYDRLGADQELDLRPPMERLFDILLASEFGARPDGMTFSFNPLWQLSAKERSEVEKMEAETDALHMRTGLVPAPVLATGIRNRLVEGDQYPGIEDAYEQFNSQFEELLEEDREIRGTEPGDVEGDEPDDGGGASGDDPVVDAEPRPLFVQRKLLNAEEFIAWAKGQGFETTVPADELHVTIAFSRAPVDWIAMGQDFTGEEDGNLTVKPGGPRVVERLGDRGAVVLMFSSTFLSWRHEDMRRMGASWDFPEYQPHVTITMNGGGVDLDQVEPFRGALLFGPELFEDLDDGAIDRIVES